MISFLIITSFLLTSQGLDRLALASFNSISMKILIHLIKNLKFVEYFLIFQRLLTRYGMIVLYLNCVKNVISQDIINILRNFFRNRKEKVVLNGQCSSWAYVSAGVPLGSILRCLLFLIYINDLSDGLICSYISNKVLHFT